MRNIILTAALAAAALASTTSCDAPTPVDSPELREVGDKWSMVLTPTDLDTLTELLNACDITPALTVTLSGVLPPVNSPTHNIAITIRMKAPGILAGCLRNKMAELGAEF